MPVKRRIGFAVRAEDAGTTKKAGKQVPAFSKL
jgi:hypothetical protein